MTEAITITREVFGHMDPIYQAVATVLEERGECRIIDENRQEAEE